MPPLCPERKRSPHFWGTPKVARGSCSLVEEGGKFPFSPPPLNGFTLARLQLASSITWRVTTISVCATSVALVRASMGKGDTNMAHVSGRVLCAVAQHEQGTMTLTIKTFQPRPLRLRGNQRHVKSAMVRLRDRGRVAFALLWTWNCLLVSKLLLFPLLFPLQYKRAKCSFVRSSRAITMER